MNKDDFSYAFPFENPRDNQMETCMKVVKALESGKKFIIIQAPTGAGKSVMAYTIANYFAHKGDGTYLLTSQKTLQDQYMEDFAKLSHPHHPMYTVKGENNYTCDLDKTKTCDIGVCKSGKSKVPCACPYKVARDATYTNKISLLNYSYFMNMMTHTFNAVETGAPVIQSFRKLLILDECHNLEKEILNYYTLNITMGDFKEYGVKFPKIPVESVDNDGCLEWLVTSFATHIEDNIKSFKADMALLGEQDPNYNKMAKVVSWLTGIENKISNVGICMERDIEVIITRNKMFEICFKPLAISNLTKEFFKFGEYVILFSATVLGVKQMVNDLGIPPSATAYLELPSTFPIKNRPIYDMSKKIGNLNYKTMEEKKPLILKYLKVLLERHKGQRGIIHSSSYELANYICENLKDPRLFTPKGKNKDFEINQFLSDETKKDGVFVSPSLTEGLDLRDDLGRFSIIVKAPYANLGDPWVKRRAEVDPNWYQNNTLKTIIQSCGRTIRSETDYSDTYILDKSVMDLINKNLKIVPNYFYDSIKEV